MMLKESAQSSRKSKLIEINAELVVIGGGMAGVCCAITAARQGTRVVLVQDRPVLGGNASSEIRLWILGATSHMGNNNRWSREGGVIDEILVENLYRNKEGNPVILDTLILEKVIAEKNITLLLNTMVYDLEKSSEGKIRAIKAFCSQNSTQYLLKAPLFCDASGDGIVSFLAGASFSMGAEGKDEFNELLAPDNGYGELLGHSIYFYSKRVEQEVKFVPPSYALKDINEIPKYKSLNHRDDGCRLWWIEYGGRNDTIHDTEAIKWELWRVVYGVWNYIKNSGAFEDVDHLTLEWVGTIPGKRESRRFEGEYILNQRNIVEQTSFEDAVAFGGWALDLHPADGVYSDLPSSNQWHSKGVYQIPYRCYISKDIENLFYAGRIISTTHVAFSSSRVMATCAHGGQAVGMAASICSRHDLLPKNLLEKSRLTVLQDALNKAGQSIPGIPIREGNDLMKGARISASSTLVLGEIPFDGPWINMGIGAGQLLPLKKNTQYRFRFEVKSKEQTTLYAELRVSSKASNYTPDVILESFEIPLRSGAQTVDIIFTRGIPADQYAFVLFKPDPLIELRGSNYRYTGILSVFNGKNKAVSNKGFQDAPADSGVEKFEFWCPRRRPEGHNLAMGIYPALEPYHAFNLKNGFTRPYLGTNAWAADVRDDHPIISIEWDRPQRISSVTLYFDTDFDHPLESSLMGHPEDVIPFCIRAYRIYDGSDRLLYDKQDNHQTIDKILFKEPVVSASLRVEFERPHQGIAPALFEIRCN